MYRVVLFEPYVTTPPASQICENRNQVMQWINIQRQGGLHHSLTSYVILQSEGLYGPVEEHNDITGWSLVISGRLSDRVDLSFHFPTPPVQQSEVTPEPRGEMAAFLAGGR